MKWKILISLLLVGAGIGIGWYIWHQPTSLPPEVEEKVKWVEKEIVVYKDSIRWIDKERIIAIEKVKEQTMEEATEMLGEAIGNDSLKVEIDSVTLDSIVVLQKPDVIKIDSIIEDNKWLNKGIMFRDSIIVREELELSWVKDMNKDLKKKNKKAWIYGGVGGALVGIAAGILIGTSR